MDREDRKAKLLAVFPLYTEDMRERHPDMKILIDVMDDDRILSEEARLALFRIYQAAINNLFRHAAASEAWVIYKLDQNTFYLEVRDNGKGFEVQNDFTKLTRDGHFGLVGMQERAAAIGGEFLVSVQPGNETTIVVKGPLTGKQVK